ncbi:MAG: hypothetical protein WKF41_18560 [Gaiellaceae bacterium]
MLRELRPHRFPRYPRRDQRGEKCRDTFGACRSVCPTERVTSDVAMTVAEASPLELLRSHHPVGASTGYMEEIRGDWHRLAASAARVSSLVVEFSALSEPELDGLVSFLSKNPRLPFRYVSVHAPTKKRTVPESSLVESLTHFPRWVSAIVTHPDVVHDPCEYRRLGRRLVFENLDARAPQSQLTELERLFDSLPEAGFCLDVAHAWSVDPTMQLANELLDSFRNRLRHLHVSSLDPEHRHAPLTVEHAAAYEPVLARCRDVPWVLEAPPPAQ